MTRLHAEARGIKDVSFAVGPGVYGMLGPNGAGKTTLLEVIATAALSDTGSVSYWGRQRQAWELRDLRNVIGFLPQNPVVHMRFRVAEYLLYCAVLRGIEGGPMRRAEVDRVLAAVALSDRSRDKIHSLSGGMRQRVALARALLGSPRLLILDEPTVGLDPGQRVAFRDALLTAGKDSTVILSSHQTEDLAAMCSALMVLVDGKIAYDGSVRDLVRQVNGQVWVSDDADVGAATTRRTADGRFRHLGGAAPPEDLTPPTLEDAYLLLLESRSQE